MGGLVGEMPTGGGGRGRFVDSVLLCCLLNLLAVPPGRATDSQPPPEQTVTATASTDEPCPIGHLNRETHVPGKWEAVRAPKKEAWERAQGDSNAVRQALRARLNGWPARAMVQRGSLPADPKAFAERVASDTWRGLAALRDRASGLPLDTVRFGTSSVDLRASRISDYTSSSNIGLFLAAVAAAHELGLESRVAALDKVRQVLTTLAGLESYKGFFFNYYDTTSLERTSHLVSFVDSAWLTAGLIVVRQAFPELAAQTSTLIDRADYGLFYDPKFKQMSHGYYVEPGVISPFHYGMLYTEARLGSLIAIGKGDVPEALWYGMVRTYPAACTWQSLPPRAARGERIHGHKVLTGYYEWRGVRFVPSWGGSMFEALMPTVLIDELRHAPDSLGANDIAHVTVQQRYAREELGLPVWGQSPCSVPTGDSYGEYGIPVLGARGYRPGAITPHASALALAVAPEAALANLQELTRRYEIYGDFGFYDAVDPHSGAVAHKYLVLDQAMLFLALANHLKPHCIQQHFAADPIGRNGLSILQGEQFLR